MMQIKKKIIAQGRETHEIMMELIRYIGEKSSQQEEIL